MKTIAVVLMVMLGLLGAPAGAQTQPYLAAKQALVLVETTGGTGSGFVVSPGVVATACHVIKGAAAIRLHFWSAKVQAPGRQAMCNERYDIAFIATTVLDGTPGLQFAAEKPAQGEQIWVWGYPLGTTIALEPSVAAGVVSATDTAQGFIALDVSGGPGNSGGPVVNAEGRVIGILVGSWMARQGPTGFKYAASGSVAATLLGASDAMTTSTQSTDKGQPTVAAVRPGDGVGPVKLGMTPAEAQEAIGLPPTHRYPNGWHIWESRKLAIYFENGKAFSIDTEDPAVVTAEGIRIGSTDTDLIKAYGAPVCSSVRSFQGKSYLGWYYEGLFVFLNGSPRQVFGIRVLPNGMASAVCR